MRVEQKAGASGNGGSVSARCAIGVDARKSPMLTTVVGCCGLLSARGLAISMDVVGVAVCGCV